MDQALGSSRERDRRDYSSYGRGGGRYHGGPRRGRGRHGPPRHRPYHGRGGGGGRHGNPNRGGGGGGGGNRFFAEPPLPMDATSVALRQITQMLVRLGHWDETQQQTLKLMTQQKKTEEESNEMNTEQGAEAADTTTEQPMTDNDSNPPTITLSDLVQIQRQNIESLTAVIAKKPDVFLSFQTAAVLQLMASRQALSNEPSSNNNNNNNSSSSNNNQQQLDAHALAGPLCTAVLHCALAVSPLSIPVYAGFGKALADATRSNDHPPVARLVTLSVQQFAADLDDLLLLHHCNDNDNHNHNNHNTTSMPTTRTAVVTARATALRRLQALLQLWCWWAAAGVLVRDEADADPVPTAVQELPLSVGGVLRALATAASLLPPKATLTRLLQATQPYAVALLGAAWWEEHVASVFLVVVENSTSAFAPGRGAQALLLPTEQADEEEEDEDDEDEEGEETPQAVCDSAQEWVQALEQDSSATSVVHQLWNEPPWKADTDEIAPLKLAMYPTCQSLTLLLGGHWQAANPDPDQPTLSSMESLVLPWDDDGAVVGRLPIFGSPTTTADAQDEDDEDEGPVHPRLQSYRQNYSALDRVILAETMRDMLTSHQVLVTETGVAKGTLKAVAEQIWSLRHVHSSPGMEYLMVQVILALVCQVPPQGFLLGHTVVSLSRVLVELTKLEPSLFPNVIVQAVHILVEHYMPALTPLARNNLSQWFALHLIAFQYQWPAQYWQHWQTYMQKGWTNARGAFVKRTLELVLENTSTPGALLRENPHWQGVWAPLEDSHQSEEASTLQTEVSNRIHKVSEDPSLLLQHLCSDEVAESHSSLGPWWRTRVVARALAATLADEYTKLLTTVNATEGGMEDDGPDESEDVLASALETIARYESLVEGVLQADASNGEGAVEGEVVLLSSVHSQTKFSPCCVEACFQALYEIKAVSSMGMVQWAIGSDPVLRWWEWTGMAMRWAMATAFSSSSDNGAMDESTDDAPSSLEAQTLKILDVILPVVKAVLTRVVAVLEQDAATNAASKKPSSIQVDAIEGAKYTICLAQMLFLDRIWESRKDTQGPDPMKEMREALDQSAIGKEALTELLSVSSDGSDTKAVGILGEIISNL